jgi:WD40 repeat protein
MNELVSSINYYNSFSLYFILLGHSQQIRCLYYVASKKVLVSSSDNCTVKIFDMKNGFSLYHFNLDCVVTKITLVERRNVKDLILLSEDPYKLIIDISKEPFSFNHYSFKYNESVQLEQLNNGNYYLLGPKLVYLFDKDFVYKCMFSSLDSTNYTFLKIYKDNVLLFDNDNYLHVTTFENLTPKEVEQDPKKKKPAAKPAKGKNETKEEEKKIEQYNITSELRVRIGSDSINDCLIYDKFAFCACQDNNLYIVNLEDKKDLKYERGTMSAEEDLSVFMMNNLGNLKFKKKPKVKDDKKKGKK